MPVWLKQQCAMQCLCFETLKVMALLQSELLFLKISLLWFLADNTSESALRGKVNFIRERVSLEAVTGQHVKLGEFGWGRREKDLPFVHWRMCCYGTKEDRFGIQCRLRVRNTFLIRSIQVKDMLCVFYAYHQNRFRCMHNAWGKYQNWCRIIHKIWSRCYE